MRMPPRFNSCVVVPLLAAGMMQTSGCGASYKAEVISAPSMQGQTLPVEFVLNLPVIEAHIGSDAVRLIVDVGGHDNITLTSDVIETMPTITRTGRSHMSYNVAGKITRDDEIIVPELRLGEIVIADVHGHSLQLPEPLQGKVDGYIGAGLLKRFRLLADYPAQIVLLPAKSASAHDQSSDAFDVSGWIALRMNDQQRTAAAINGRTITAGWDTGASHTVIDNDLAQTLFGPDRTTVDAWLTLDGREFDPIEMRVIELRGAGVGVLLGHNFFTQHRVLFDFPNGTVYVEPQGKRSEFRGQKSDIELRQSESRSTTSNF